jgi:hypothetical protein
MSQDKEFLAALDSFGAPQQGAGASVAATANIDICGTYNQVKPILTGILPFIKLIPVIGSKAYTAISALMQVLNAMCPSAADSVQSSATQSLKAAGLQGTESLPANVAATLAQLPASSLQILARAQQEAAGSGVPSADDFGSNGF